MLESSLRSSDLDDTLYGVPLYYPLGDTDQPLTSSQVVGDSDSFTARVSTALQPLAASSCRSSSASSLRRTIPYLSGVSMSEERLVYQPPNTALSRMMSLGIKTVSGISKTLSFGVGANGGPSSSSSAAVHNTIADWDDGSSQRKPPLQQAPSLQPGGKPIPSISVSCEMGPFARNFYELKQNRDGETYSERSRSSSADFTEALMVPQWLERSATPEEIAVERQYAAKASAYDEMYWRGVEESRRQDLHRLRNNDDRESVAGTTASSAAGTKRYSVSGPAVRAAQPHAFCRSGSQASTATDAASVMTAQRTSVSPFPVAVGRRSSIPFIQRPSVRSANAPSVTFSASPGSVRQTSTSGPRWNSSAKYSDASTAAYRREASISSVTSSVLDMSSQASSSKGSLPRKTSSIGSASAAHRKGSASSAGNTAAGSSRTSHAKIIECLSPAVFSPQRLREKEEDCSGGSQLPTVSWAPAASPSRLSADPSAPHVHHQAAQDDSGGRVQVSPQPPSNGGALHSEQVLGDTASSVESSAQLLGAETSGAADVLRASGLAAKQELSSVECGDAQHVNSAAVRTRPPIPWPSEWAFPTVFTTVNIAALDTSPSPLPPDERRTMSEGRSLSPLGKTQRSVLHSRSSASPSPLRPGHHRADSGRCEAHLSDSSNNSPIIQHTAGCTEEPHTEPVLARLSSSSQPSATGQTRSQTIEGETSPLAGRVNEQHSGLTASTNEVVTSTSKRNTPSEATAASDPSRGKRRKEATSRHCCAIQ